MKKKKIMKIINKFIFTWILKVFEIEFFDK